MVVYLGEKIFLEEVSAGGEVWVARGVHKNVYAQEIEGYAFSLPAWSTQEKILEYLQGKLLGQRFAPHAVPLEDFTNRWLSDKAMAIAEVQLNPTADASRVLALTAEEFRDRMRAS